MIFVNLVVKMELKSFLIVSSSVIGLSLSSLPPHSEDLGMRVIMLMLRSFGSWLDSKKLLIVVRR